MQEPCNKSEFLALGVDGPKRDGRLDGKPAFDIARCPPSRPMSAKKSAHEVAPCGLRKARLRTNSRTSRTSRKRASADVLERRLESASTNSIVARKLAKEYGKNLVHHQPRCVAVVIKCRALTDLGPLPASNEVGVGQRIRYENARYRSGGWRVRAGRLDRVEQASRSPEMLGRSRADVRQVVQVDPCLRECLKTALVTVCRDEVYDEVNAVEPGK